MLVGAWMTPEPALTLVLASSAALMVLLALSFRQMTISDDFDGLRVAFGPLPLFRRHIPYANIEAVERGRTTVLDGWGIHMSLDGGWVWNLWGFNCVDVHFKQGRRLRIGTDDPEGLESFLKERIAGE